MITFTDHFKPQREIINNLLLIEGEQPKTTYYCHKTPHYTMSKEELKDWYILNFSSFPLYTSEKSDGVTVPNTFQHTYRKYHDLDVVKDTQSELRKELDGLDRDSILLDLEEYIIEWIENLFIDFAKAIASLKNGPVFACINDDLIVMKNLVKFYTDVRNSDDIQLNFFHNVSIPKSVADQMTDVLIILLSDRIMMCEPDYHPVKTTSTQLTNQTNFKINWLAPQQEFAELLHELTNKGYILDILINMTIPFRYKTGHSRGTIQYRAGTSFMDTLIKCVRARGYIYEMTIDGNYIVVGEVKLRVNFRERTTKFKADKPYQEFEWRPNGKIVFRLDDRLKSEWGDSKTKLLEDQLPKILAKLDISAKQEEEYLKNARIWQENWEKQRKLQAKRDAHQHEERESFKELIMQAKRWKQAQLIREYLAAIPNLNNDWLAWARQKADWLDPIVMAEDEWMTEGDKDIF